MMEVTEGLRPCGYRPVRVRPWRRGDEVFVAVVWTRDGRAWKLETGLTAEEVKTRDAEQSKAGMVAEDVAAYETKDGDRHALLWRKADKGEKTAVYVEVPAAKHNEHTDVYKAEGMVPSTVQALPGGVVRFAGVWWKGEKKPEGWTLTWDNGPRAHADKVTSGEKLLLDASVSPAGPLVSPRPGRLAALKSAEANVKKNSKDGTAVWARALALVQLGRDNEALAGLDATTKAFPTFAQVYRERAMLHARMGRAEEARSDLEEYTKRGGTGTVLQEAQVALYLGEADASKALDEALRAAPSDASLAYDSACWSPRRIAPRSTRGVPWRCCGRPTSPATARCRCCGRTRSWSRYGNCPASANCWPRRDNCKRMPASGATTPRARRLASTA